MVIFIGILLSEQAQYSKVSSLSDPFENKQKVSERVVVNGEDARAWLHETGEVFLLMPGGKFNLTNQARELEEGVLFMNSAFQDQEYIDQSKAGFQPPFDLVEARINGGLIKMGPVVVGVPQGTAVLKRDSVRKESLIYAHNHPVSLFLPTAKESFIVPAGYMIIVKEERAEVLGSVFFTKLKKDLDLQLLEPDSLGMESVQAALLQGVELSNAWEKQIIEYAKDSIIASTRFAPNSMMGRLLAGLGYIQRYYALGIDEAFKSEYRYNRLRSELINTYYAFLENNSEKAQESSQAFKAVYQSAEWARFFIESPQYLNPWLDFARNQRVWYFGAFPGDLEVPALRVLWGPEEKIETFSQYQDNFYLYEVLVSRGYVAPAREQLEFINANFVNIDFTNLENKNDITHARRQLSLLLQKDPQRSSSLIYNLYVLLVQSEQEIVVGKAETEQEIRLEVAQELLFFLEELIDSNTRQDDVFMLLDVYENLKIGELAESLGRNVFSSRERDTLERVKNIGSLTDTERNLVINDNKTVGDLLQIREELRKKEEIIAAQPVGIQTEDDFIGFLESNAIQAQGVKVQINERGDSRFMSFSQTSYGGLPLNGTFNTSSQSFSFLQLGSVEERNANTSNFKGFLVRMREANREEEVEEEDDDSINPDSSAAIIQRRSVIEVLDSEGIEAKFNQVKPTNREYTKAKVEEAKFERTYLLTFDFDFGPPIRVRNVEVREGRNKFLLPGRVFEIDGIREEILEAIEAKLAENKEKE